MVMSEWPEIREIGINIRRSPNVLKSVSFRDSTTFRFVLREDDYIRILVGEVLIWSMALNELVHRDLAQSVTQRGGIGTLTPR